MNIKQKIREVSDWPIEGVNFKDITTLLQDGETFRYIIDNLTEPYLNLNLDKIVVIDARGFLLGSVMAYKLGCGVSLVRKKGKLPYKTIEASYKKEYGPDTLAMHEDAIKEGEKVVIVDDLMATGGTMSATVEIVEELKGEILGISVIVDLPFLDGSQKFRKYNFRSLVSYEQE